MNEKYLCKFSCKNSYSLLRYQQNTAGDYFYLPHPVHACMMHNTDTGLETGKNSTLCFIFYGTISV